ncbi:MAG: WG repeat-containing protein [Clostridia bacterium]|nr:WG repeat-containing protein [Clostridia bacterium]
MSASRNRGRRYDNEPKLNYKKLFGVIIAFVVLIMIIVSIVKLAKGSGESQEATVTDYFSAYTDEKWVVIDNNGDIVIDNNEEMVVVPDSSKDVFVTVYDIDDATGTYKTKVVNSKNEEIFTEYDLVEAIENYDSKQNIWYEKALRVSKDGKYGLIDLEGNKLLECEYEEIKALQGAESNILIKKDGKMGLVNEAGQKIIDTTYNNILTLEEGYTNEYIIVNENNQHGIITTSGKITVEPQYENIKYVNSSDYYAIKAGESWKLVNTNGEAFLDGLYNEILEVKGDNIIVVKDGKYGVVNKNNEVLIPLEYDSLKYTFSIYYIAKKGDKFGIINTNNETIVDFEYTSMNYVKSGNFIIADKTETETVVFDSNLAQKITGIISEVNTDKGYIKVYVDNDYKYYNFKFEEKSNVDILSSNTLLLSKKDGKYGYIDKSGNVVVDYQFDDATEQNKFGYAAVKKDGKWGSINKAGVQELEPSVNLESSIYIDFIEEWHLSDEGMFYTK